MKIDNRIYNCCEQYMMHRKATLFEDWDTATQIMRATHPNEQKQLGRGVKNFNKEKWEEVAREIVYQSNLVKFTQHQDLKQEMIDMGDRLFVEASPSDAVWGIGMHQDEDGIEDPANWKGTNWLGHALNRVKNYLLEEQDYWRKGHS